MRRKERKNRLWRQRLRRAFALFVLMLILTSASVSPEKEFDLLLSPFIAGQRFDWIGWETDALLEEVTWWLQGYSIPSDKASQKEEVLSFLEREWRIAELENHIRVEMARLPQPQTSSPFESSPILPPSVTALQDELDELYRRQQMAAPRIERIVSWQVTQVLVGEGLGHREQIWPPVTFRFNDMPTYLVISPRDEIRVYRDAYLLPDIPATERSNTERDIEKRLNVSALVDDVGGIGSWPTMVIEGASLHSLLDTVAHEWTHTYLFFRPLGMHYDDSRDLTTMNETVASIVGGEVADLVIARYYPELAPPPAADDPLAETPTSPDEDFNQAMRRIRLRVDELLAEGRVSEAEEYMEAERQKLVDKGYYLRRLNQAYFAFHGSYATSPASVDPIGPWMRQLRAQSGSLKDFLDEVAQMRSRDDLLRALDEEPIN